MNIKYPYSGPEASDFHPISATQNGFLPTFPVPHLPSPESDTPESVGIRAQAPKVKTSTERRYGVLSGSGGDPTGTTGNIVAAMLPPFPSVFTRTNNHPLSHHSAGRPPKQLISDRVLALLILDRPRPSVEDASNDVPAVDRIDILVHLHAFENLQEYLDENEVVTTKEVADHFGHHPQTVRRRLKSLEERGDIGMEDVGKRLVWWFSKEE